MLFDERTLRAAAIAMNLWIYGVCPLLKFLIYVAWCRWGGELLGVKPGASAWKFGAIRFGIGLLAGAVVFGAARLLGPERMSAIYSVASPTAAYVIAFVPIRWVEWWILARLMTGRPSPLWPESRRGMAWLAGGTAASFLADLPLLWVVGFLLGIG